MVDGVVELSVIGVEVGHPASVARVRFSVC
jgi:hypothetical protein